MKQHLPEELDHFSLFKELVRTYILTDDMASYDPYDVWKTSAGVFVKKRFYTHKIFTLLAGGLSIFDTFFNNKTRRFYSRHDYAVVRALATSILTGLYQLEKEPCYLKYAKKNISWLIENAQQTGTGIGWGLGFFHPVSKTVVYPENAAFSTITPYILEALIEDEKVHGIAGSHRNTLSEVFNFFNNDIQILNQTDDYQVTSYGTQKDRKVVNAVSYTLYSLLLLNDYFKETRSNKIIPLKLYNYIKSMQRPDGSWFYSEEGKPFIDCFHSCIVLKNLIKSRPFLDIDPAIIEKGYQYLKNNFRDPEKKLYKRFALTNKPGLIKYDLYDNAEMLNLAVLMDDQKEAKNILLAIREHFFGKSGIYSSLDILGFKRNKNMLRWAVLPFLYSLTNYNLKYETSNH